MLSAPLPKYQNNLGEIAKVVMPAYRTKFFNENEWTVDFEGTIYLHFNPVQFKILKEKSNKLGFDPLCG
jgi:starch synthase